MADLYDKYHDIKAAYEWVRLRADPGNWQVPAYVASDFASMFVYERAQIAKAANKPFILEETGKEVRPDRTMRPLVCISLFLSSRAVLKRAAGIAALVFPPGP